MAGHTAVAAATVRSRGATREAAERVMWIYVGSGLALVEVYAVP